MGAMDIFNKDKYNLPKNKANESLSPSQNLSENNTLFGQTMLGNQILRQNQGGQQGANFQLLYITTASATNAGRIVDMSVLSRNNTVMSCVNIIARALAQCSLSVVYEQDDGTFVNAIQSDKAGPRDKNKAKQVLNLLKSLRVPLKNTIVKTLSWNGKWMVKKRFSLLLKAIKNDLILY